ncbi:BTAD domain-containing putative transcriptional regulator [Streptomyces sp. NPDC006645]|uniref:BTAD domain-containing putative transcriptional regulator n=1 Tax=unclassified Streptomyces TaxID=2593676 RepID=UPI0033A415CC
MQFRLLGPMEVVHNGETVGLGGTKQRATLGFLILHANKVVATSQLLNALWGVDDAPMTARKILQNAIYGLRGVLPSCRTAGDEPGGSLLTQPPGYMLSVPPEQVDLHLFHTWVGQGRDRLVRNEPEAAALLLHDALELWRGPALADLVEKGIEWPELTAIQNTRLDVLEDYFETQLACGRHHEVLAELETMVSAEPLRERSCGHLMLALYRCGRQADALAVYSRVRAVLVENLGLEPGRSLQWLQQAILTQDPELALERAPVRGLPPTMDGEAARERLTVTAPAGGTGGTGGSGGGGGGGGTGEVVRLPEARPDRRAGQEAGAGGTAPDGRDRRQVCVVSVRTHIAPSLGGADDQDHEDLLDGAALLVREQIERFGGTVTASIGSVCFGLFGLDDSDGNEARQAVLAALAIRDALDVSIDSGSAAPQSAVHAVVTSGEVLLRRRGRGEPPTVVGAVLDECQRLLSDVPAGEVRVSDTVKEASEHSVFYRRCAAPAVGWRALGGCSEDEEWDVEVDVLRGLMRRAQHRSVPHLVTVLGEAGSGKSRLLGELACWAVDQPEAPQVLMAAHTSEETEEFPLTVASHILSMYCDIGPDDDEETAQAALAREVHSLYPSEETARLRLERLRFLLITEGVELHYGQLCPGEILDAWREFIQEAAQRRPLVLCLDDLHLAPDTVLDAVEGLAEAAGSGALFVVACAGPELLARRPSWAGGKSHTTTVTLDWPERITNEQLVEFLLSASRSEGSESFSG